MLFKRFHSLAKLLRRNLEPMHGSGAGVAQMSCHRSTLQYWGVSTLQVCVVFKT